MGPYRDRPTGGVVAGAIVIVGSMVGVAKGAAPAGAEVEIRPEGVYDLAKVPADALAAGAIAKVDPATGIVGAAGTKSIGWIVAAAGAGSTTARVRLVPCLESLPPQVSENGVSIYENGCPPPPQSCRELVYSESSATVRALRAMGQ